jgi:hypothetical protein
MCYQKREKKRRRRMFNATNYTSTPPALEPGLSERRQSKLTVTTTANTPDAQDAGRSSGPTRNAEGSWECPPPSK